MTLTLYDLVNKKSSTLSMKKKKEKVVQLWRHSIHKYQGRYIENFARMYNAEGQNCISHPELRNHTFTNEDQPYTCQIQSVKITNRTLLCHMLFCQGYGST